MTLTGDHKTNSSYGAAITDFSSDASMCSISSVQDP